MRSQASIMHLDLDAFYASVEQRDKPSLRGKPVVVGGIGGRGVVATASYEARRFGVRSAMPTHQARALCPNAAYLGGRFAAYRHSSEIVMGLLREISPAVEPLSMDEAFVDLSQSPEPPEFTEDALRTFVDDLRERVARATGGITASVGVGTSKFIAKVASELDKPDGMRVVLPGTEVDLLRPMQATVIPGVGPATSERLRRAGYHTVADLQDATETELVTLVGDAHGRNLFRLCRAEDDRKVEPDREAKSVSAEGTYETDLTDRRLMEGLLRRQANDVGARLRKHGISGRRVNIKVRLHDFTTFTRATTLASPTDDVGVIARTAARLLGEVDTSGGVRLLGVGVSGLADWVQDELFDTEAPDESDDDAEADVGLDEPTAPEPAQRRWHAGSDVEHSEHGRGWVWGSGRGVVTVRFETAFTGPGRVRSFAADDEDLLPTQPLNDWPD